MISENGKTIFDNVKAHKILNGNIPEIEVNIKPFHINKDKFETNVIVNENKHPTFKFVLDNELNDFFGFPDIALSNNPEYKYKYPKLSQGEYIKEQLQTDAGTPNQLNRFMR